MEGMCPYFILTFLLLAKAQGLSFVEVLGENVKSYT